jgi:pimeloyl-ACP methyl ester carboxylesterase
VVGHSLGGVIAQQMLVSGDASIRAGILVSTSSRLNEQASRAWQRLADQVEAVGIPDNPAGQIRGYAENWAAANQDTIALHSRIAAATSPRVYAEQARAASSYDYTEALGLVSCPVLVVQGLADRLPPPAS